MTTIFANQLLSIGIVLIFIWFSIPNIGPRRLGHEIPRGLMFLWMLLGVIGSIFVMVAIVIHICLSFTVWY